MSAWQFASHFRRQAFGWRSNLPIQRIKEALSEIKQAARQDPVLAAEGAVILLEKLSPALAQVDSSSGAIGTAVNRAVETLVPIIAKTNVDQKIRQRWLKRLWEAYQDDEIPYIEHLGDFWGELCVTPEIASTWADEFFPLVEHAWSPQNSGHGYFKGTIVCLSSLYVAGRHEQLLALLNRAPFIWWHYRQWGVRALVAMGKKTEAIRYAEESRGLNAPVSDIARTCEEILLSSGLEDEAYRLYAADANQGTTHLGTFRAIAKKYPHKPKTEILRDLIARHPGSEGKWFAAAKDAGLFDVAMALVAHSPADPRTLVRAAKDYVETRPDFAVASGLAALRWISLGHGYDITGLEVLDAFNAAMQAAPGAGMDEASIKARITEMISGSSPTNEFVRKILTHRLSS
ncbi:Tetratricopeptide repeat protein [Gammaproteobacteria bacterium]